MAVLQIQRISLCALKKDRKAILETLQRRGVVEISDVALEENDNFFQKSDTVQAKQGFDRNVTLANQALDVLDTYAPVKTSMLSMFEGRTPVTVQQFQDRVQKREHALAQASKLTSLSKKLAEAKAEIVKRRTQLDALEPWMQLDVSLRFTGTKKTAAFIGSFPEMLSSEEIYSRIAQHAPDADISVDCISTSTEQVCVFIVTHICNAQAVENALRASGFVRPASPPKEPPAQRKQVLEQYISQAQAEIASIEKEIVSMADAREELRFLIDDMAMRSEKYEMIGHLAQSRRAFILSGYIPKRYSAALEEELSRNFDVAISFSDPSEEDDAPVLLKNSPFAEPVEGVLASYSLPGKGEIDPTSIMCIFYYVFFGMMLSDFAYGAIIFLGTLFVLTKFKNMEQGLRSSMKMFCFCGFSTMFWGILFGSYFGNVVDQVAQTFFGVTLPAGGHVINPVWFEPLNNPMKMLTFCLFLGLIHLFTGQAINGYLCLKQKRFKDFLANSVFIYMLVGGAILFGLSTEMVCSILGVMQNGAPLLSASVGSIFGWVALIGAVGIICTAGSAKNPLAAAGLGAYALYNNVTGYLSDLLSYSRLLALGLATGVIGTVINQMGAMGGPNVIGAVLFIVVFLFGHLANLGINALGAYVHTNRLQYVEFFGKFYEGGGRPFEPFAAHTKYYKFKED